jgi:hypothetical protein
VKGWIKTAVVACVAITATASLAFVAGRSVSPAQRAANAAPPPAATPTAEVEKRALRSEIAGRAQVAFGDGTVLMPEGRAEVAVVTSAEKGVGDVVDNGTVIAEISGEPVIAFEGNFRPYRDIRVGDQGPDIEQLNLAVGSLGYRHGKGNKATVALFQGLSALLKDRGYTLPADNSPREEPVPPDETKGAEAEAEPKDAPAKPQQFLPRQWWVAAPSLPAPVVASSVTVGGDAGESATMTLSTGSPFLTVTLPLASAPEIAEGTAVEFTTNAGEVVKSTVAEVTPAEGEETGTAINLTVAEPGGLKPGDRGGIRIVLAEASESLVVPVAAITRDASGGTVVKVLAEDGSIQVVPVGVAIQVEGYVSLTATDRLSPGDQVILGNPR